MADWAFNKNGVIVTIQGPVVTVRVDRPDLKNGMDKDSFFAMEEALTHVSQDREAAVIVYTGTGDYFYTGGRVDANDPEDSRLYGIAQEKYYAAKALIHLPSIAAVNGHCQKGGMSWLFDCDMAVAKSWSTFGYPEVRMGGVPMLVMADSMCLPKKVALEAYYSGKPISADTMYRLGYLNAVASDEEFEMTVDKLVHMVIDHPKTLIQMTHDCYYEMASILGAEERLAYAHRTLQEKVLPAMKNEKQEYNI